MQGRGETIPGVVEEELVELDDSVTESEQPDTETEVAEDGDSKEPVRKTVEREFAKLKAKSAGAEGEETSEAQTEAEPVAPEGAVKVRGKGVKDEALDPELSPPERLNAQHKQIFNNLPKGLKRAATKMFADHEKQFTQAVNQEVGQYRQATEQARGVLEVLQPVAPDWLEKGISLSRGVAELVAAQAKLTHKDPEVRRQHFVKLAQRSGIDLRTLTQGGGEQQSTNVPDISQHPQFVQLRQQLETLTSKHQQEVQTENERTAEQVTAELRAVQHDRNPAGQYLYPEMHGEEAEVYIESVKPLVLALKRADPGLSWGDALVEAIHMKRRRANPGYSPQLNQTKFPPAQTQNNNRAYTAAVSVRGKTAPVVNGADYGTPPPEALVNPRATATWALEQIRRGRGA